jgi:hypothetical protein
MGMHHPGCAAANAIMASWVEESMAGKYTFSIPMFLHLSITVCKSSSKSRK